MKKVGLFNNIEEEMKSLGLGEEEAKKYKVLFGQ